MQQSKAPEIPESPAKITELHVLGRPATDNEMKPITGTAAWSKVTHVEIYYGRGLLKGGNAKYSPEARKSAGMEYTAIFDAWQPASTDSTQALNVTKSRNPSNGGDIKADAGARLAYIHSALRPSDRQIVSMVCTEGYTPPQAIRVVCGEGYRFAVPARFREALDSLCAAMDLLRMTRKL